MKILREPEVLKRVPYSSMQIRRLEAAGVFPRRVKLSPSGTAVGWIESEIDTYIEERVAERDGAAAVA